MELGGQGLSNAPPVRRHHRQAGGERFDDRDGLAFVDVPGGQDEHVGPGQQSRFPVRVHLAVDHALDVGRQRRDQAPQVLRLRLMARKISVRDQASSDVDGEPQVGPPAAERGHRRNRLAIPLRDEKRAEIQNPQGTRAGPPRGAAVDVAGIRNRDGARLPIPSHGEVGLQALRQYDDRRQPVEGALDQISLDRGQRAEEAPEVPAVHVNHHGPAQGRRPADGDQVLREAEARLRDG